MLYAILELSGTFQETNRICKPSPMDIIQKKKYFYFEEFYKHVHHIINSPGISYVIIVLKNDFDSVYFPALQEIKGMLVNLIKNGKQVYFVSVNYSSTAIYLSSVCTKRYIHKLGRFFFFGFSINRIYFKKLLDRFNVSVEIYRRGVYKDANSEMSMEVMDDYLKEAYTELLNTMNDEFIKDFKTNFKKDDKAVKEFLKGRILFSEEAVQQHYVDAIGTVDDVIDEITGQQPRLQEYAFTNISKQFKKGKKKIALLFLEGIISEGESGSDIFAGKKAGSDSFIPDIQEISDNPHIHGVLLRINSPGGIGVASYDIAQEVKKCNKKKPVVASIGNIGASGGYWIASACDKIFTHTASWIGSIGVIFMLFNLRKLIQNYNINYSSIKTGKYAHLYSIFESRSKAAKELIDMQMENTYQKFIAFVSENRNISPAEVEKSAQGRIWPGKMGEKLKLVDACGSMDDAINYLKQKLQVHNVQIDFYPKIKYRFFERIVYKNLMSDFQAPAAHTSIINDVINLAGLSMQSSISTLEPEALCVTLGENPGIIP